jgi:hypothetical protein
MKQRKEPFGRPTKYRPEYCEALVDHMAQGLSFESFAGTIGVCDDTLRYWCDKFPDFSHARKLGTQANRIFWEKLGIQGATGQLQGFNATSWIFNMKNRFKWTDRLDTNTNHSGKIDIPAINFIIEPPASDSEET